MEGETIYTVQRLNWRIHEGQWYRLPGSTPVRSFPDRDSAAALARDQDWGYRRALNPFRCGGLRLHYQTHFDAPRLADWLLDHDLDPPAVTADSGEWAVWWERHNLHFSLRQRAAVWEALDRVRFVVARPEPKGRTMHLVGRPAMAEDPVTERMYADPLTYVGTRPYMVCDTAGVADSVCADLLRTHLAREGIHFLAASVKGWERSGGRRAVSSYELDNYNGHPTDYAERLPCIFHGADPYPGQSVYLVLRRAWALRPGEGWRLHPVGDSAGAAVAVYDTLAAADAALAELEAIARAEVPSPFRFGSVLEWTTLHASAVWGILSELRPITFTGLWSDYWASDQRWNEWWDETVGELTPDQTESVWDLFDKLRFYEVVSVEYRE